MGQVVVVDVVQDQVAGANVQAIAALDLVAA